MREDIDFATKVNQSLFDSLKALAPGAKNRGVKPDTETGPKSLISGANALQNRQLIMDNLARMLADYLESI